VAVVRKLHTLFEFMLFVIKADDSGALPGAEQKGKWCDFER
jgi:hypothetical protein